MKKNILYVVAGSCTVLAVLAYIYLRPQSTGISSIDIKDEILVKCMQCDVSYSMNKRQFYSDISDAQGNSSGNVLLKCQKCKKDGIVRAEKCEKCGNIFPRPFMTTDFVDRCPKCSYSKLEEARKNAGR